MATDIGRDDDMARAAGGDSDARVDLDACDREPIQFSGAIQPHGLLLIADGDSQKVIAGAGDVEARLAPAWLGQPLALLLGQDLQASLAMTRAVPGTVAIKPVAGRHGAFDATLTRIDRYVAIELEPRGDDPGSAAILSRLDSIGTAFERATDLPALAERAAIAFRELTGFDRVMIYQFLDDGAGVVIAEERAPGLQTFLNHRFPASDIPRQARELYIRNRVRVIPDASYVPAPIRPADAELAGIDLSDIGLRSVSPIHLQYLRNMGVAASASISIVKDGLLWGLVACHHETPRTIGYSVRVACKALAGGLARQIRAKEEAALYRERVRLRSGEDQLIAQLAARPSGELPGRSTWSQMQALVSADGFAMVQGAEIIGVGHRPPEAAIRDLAAWLASRGGNDPFATDSLAAHWPAAEAFRDTASGLLATKIGGEGDGTLMWFRAEQVETVNWAGNPHDKTVGPGGVLTPRSSFEAWCETVHGRARRWSLPEIETAARVRRSLIDLRQSRRLRELNRELSATLADKDALVQEKDYLLREVNHRVQNSIQLIQAFLGLQAQADGNPEVVEHLGEAQRRLSAVALVHRRLYQSDQLEAVDLGRYLQELVADMLQSMGAGWMAATSLDLAPILIPADRAVHVGLILTELVINANKYAYDGRPGPLAIALEPYRDKFRLIVADQGKGGTSDREGFGTRMIKAMVQRLGGTLERHDNQPGLRAILTAPIE